MLLRPETRLYSNTDEVTSETGCVLAVNGTEEFKKLVRESFRPYIVIVPALHNHLNQCLST